jgi:uroporphyrinogen decarboxylase
LATNRIMTPRERVLSAFAHVEPDFVPRWCGASPEFLAKARRALGVADDEAVRLRFGDDFRRVSARYAGPEEPLSAGATYRTVFGVERHGHGYILEETPFENVLAMFDAVEEFGKYH